MRAAELNMPKPIIAAKEKTRKTALTRTLAKDFKKNKLLYLMIFPVVVFYFIFMYMPMYGAVIAFKDYAPRVGVLDSKWVGMTHFISFFTGAYFWRVFSNTILLSLYDLVFVFPLPLIFALLLNEIKSLKIKNAMQTITYLPHFISLIVICGMITDFTSSDGVITYLLGGFKDGQAKSLMLEAGNFPFIYILSNIWQELGWNAIVFLAALSAIDPQLYEAATIDGAGRFGKMFHVTLPGLMNTFIILLILRIGSIMNVGFEKIILLQNDLNADASEVISSFVYKRGLVKQDYSYAAAVGLFNSAINFVFLIAANTMSKKYNETSLW